MLHIWLQTYQSRKDTKRKRERERNGQNLGLFELIESPTPAQTTSSELKTFSKASIESLNYSHVVSILLVLNHNTASHLLLVLHQLIANVV